MKVSPDILSLTPYRPGKPISEARRELGIEHFVKLASNENPMGPSPSVAKALTEAFQELHRYPDAASYDLINAFSEIHNVPRESVAVGNGSNELIDLLIRIYCEPGDAILTSQLAFIAYKICAQAARVQTVETPIQSDGTFDLVAMREALDSHPRIRLIFIANPNNPTGTIVKKNDLLEFLSDCEQREVLVVLDEAYAEFVRSADHLDGLKVRKEFSNVVVLRTMSKVYGLASLRIGFAIAPIETIDLIGRVRNPFNISSLAQVAGVSALRDQDHVDKVRKLTWNGLDTLIRAVETLRLPFFKSEGNFLLVDCQQDSDKLFNSLLRKGVITRPVKNYGLKNHLRFTVGLESENNALIESLKLSLKE